MNKNFWIGVFATLAAIAILLFVNSIAKSNDEYTRQQDTRHSAGASHQAEHQLALNQGNISEEGN